MESYTDTNAEKRLKILARWNELCKQTQEASNPQELADALGKMNEAYHDALSLVTSGLLNLVSLGKDY